jgi:hypothetical protein
MNVTARTDAVRVVCWPYSWTLTLYCSLQKKAEALDALRKAWEAGFKDPVWARRDPDLTMLHRDPEFERMYPEKPASAHASGSH